MTIRFYSNSDQWAFLSNFSRHGFHLDGKYWMTVEHYFQAAKFSETAADYAEQIRLAATPRAAKQLGRSRKQPIRSDWEQGKEQVMRRAVREKFATHEDIRLLLLRTADQELIENAPNDYYWGCGRSGSGQNRLGHILMDLRSEIAANNDGTAS